MSFTTFSSQPPTAAQAGPSQVPCRHLFSTGSQQGTLLRAREERRQHWEFTRQVARNQKAKIVEALGVNQVRISRSPVEQLTTPNRQLECTKTSRLLLSRSRAALSPCLSSPSTVYCSISRTAPGGSEQLLQKLSRSVATNNRTQVTEDILKIEKKAYSLSPSWCSPNIHIAAYKHSLSKSKNQTANNEILSVFLKNNGGYLDDSDDEDDDEEEEKDESFNSLRAPATLIQINLHQLDYQTPRSSASSLITSSTGSTRRSSNYSTKLIQIKQRQLNYRRTRSSASSLITSSSGSTRKSSNSSAKFCGKSSRQNYLNRVQRPAPLTPPQTGSRSHVYTR